MVTFRQFGCCPAGPDRLADTSHRLLAPGSSFDEVMPSRNDAGRIGADAFHVRERDGVSLAT
jgi:hypothetical protein